MVIARGIDTTFGAWAAVHHRWSSLPGRIGLSADMSAGWDRFIELDANRDLPTFLTDVVEIEPAVLATFTRAHHFAAMHGIVSDRVVDGQVHDEELLVARAALLKEWLGALAAGVGGMSRAREFVGATLVDWKRGIDLERQLIASRSTDWSSYASSVGLRLRWVSATSRAMLVTHGASAAAHALENTYDRFMLALQIMDDHVDRAEDEEHRGSSFACIRELTSGPRGLAGLLIADASASAARGGLSRLGTWLREFSCMLLQTTGVGRA